MVVAGYLIDGMGVGAGDEKEEGIWVYGWMVK